MLALTSSSRILGRSLVAPSSSLSSLSSVSPSLTLLSSFVAKRSPTSSSLFNLSLASPSSYTSSSLLSQQRTIFSITSWDEARHEISSPEELRALELKQELLKIVDSTQDFDTQRKAYEELLELQRTHGKLLCAPGEDIFGLPLYKGGPRGGKELAIEGAKSTFTLEPYLLERKSIIDQLVIRETMNVGRHIKITEGGRIQSYSCLVICGTGRGAAAYGYGKAKTPSGALSKANLDAEKHMIVVDLWEDRTIPYDIESFFGGTKLQMRTGREGAGMVCTPRLRRLCDAFGLKDITIKIHGRRNVHAIVKAFFKAMLSFTHPETRARGLGQQVYDHSKIWRNRNPVLSYGQLDNILKRVPNKEDDKWL